DYTGCVSALMGKRLCIVRLCCDKAWASSSLSLTIVVLNPRRFLKTFEDFSFALAKLKNYFSLCVTFLQLPRLTYTNDNSRIQPMRTGMGRCPVPLCVQKYRQSGRCSGCSAAKLCYPLGKTNRSIAGQ